MLVIKVLAALQDRFQQDRGAVAAEYAVLLALIAVALVTIIGTFTGAITMAFQEAINALNGA